MAINVKGVWLAMKYEIPAMLATAGGGAIVNASSIVGVIGFPKVAIYTASKHAVIGLTKAVALEYAHSTASGAEIREPATSDVEDFEVHLQNEGRKRRKARTAGKGPLKFEAGALHALRQHSVLRSYLN